MCAITLVAVAFVSFTALLLGMSRELAVYDEGIILSGALRILAGQVIHRDFYALYGPAQFYATAFALKLPGNAFINAMLYDLFVRTATLVALFAIVSAQSCAAIAFASTIGCGIWMLVVGDHLYVIFPCILVGLIGTYSIGRFSAGSAGQRTIFSAGIFTAIATLFRYDVGVLLAISHLFSLALLSWVSQRSEPLNDHLRRLRAGILSYVAGMAIVLVPAAMVFLVVVPVRAFVTDVIEFPARYYAQMRSLPFPGLTTLLRSPSEGAVYLPVLAATLAALEGVRVFKLPNRPNTASATMIAFGVTALALFCKGVVRVSVLQMFLAIVPALVVIAVGFQIWWKRSWVRQGCVILTLITVLVPTASAFTGFVHRSRLTPDRFVVGWLAAKIGAFTPSAMLPEGCQLGSAMRFAWLNHDYARVVAFLAAHTSPTDRILVATDRHDKIFMNPIWLYFAADRLPATHWSEYDPGLQTRSDIQSQMVDELKASRTRWVIRDATFDRISEPNGSALSSGVTVLDSYLNRYYRKVSASGPVSIWLIDEEEFEATPNKCEAA